MNYFHTPLQPEKYFHIFNHANGDEQIFREKDNYRFFLEKFEHHIIPVADLYAYCLMPNHFHFLLKFKDENYLFEHFQSTKGSLKYDISKLLSKSFSNSFSAYTLALNKRYNRMGNLFKTPFGRIEIDSEKYLKNLICYIHQNPVNHGFVENIEDWNYSSYNAFQSNSNSKLKREEVIGWFGDLENFKFVHRQLVDLDCDNI